MADVFFSFPRRSVRYIVIDAALINLILLINVDTRSVVAVYLLVVDDMSKFITEFGDGVPL